MPRKSGNRLRLLAWCDSPLSITGFGVVAKNILGRIHDSGRFDVACVGINHFDEHVERIWEARDDVPYRVFVGQDLARQENGVLVPVDPMGRQRALNMVAGGDADVFFVMRDLWDMVVPQMPGQPPLSSHFPLRLQAAKERGRNFRVLAHFPLEYQLQPQWRPMLDAIDYGLCFTEAGMPQLAPWKDSVAFAQQGADAAVFKPLPREGWGEAVVIEPGPGGPIRRAVRIADAADFRRRKMMLPEGPLFVVTCVNRNQPRKDIPATIAAFRRFLELRGGDVPGGPRPVLWLQMRPDDAFGDVRQAVAAEGLEVGRDVFFPPYFNVGVGWTEAELNMLYNASDLFVSTSVAEGFGLTNVEAGMAGCPTLVPGHTGFLQTARVLGMPYVKTAAPEVRPQIADSPVHPTDVGDMAERILAHYREPAALRAAVESHLAAFRRTFSWDEVFKTYWEPTLAAIEEDLRGTEGRRRANAGRYLYVCDEAFGDVLGATKAMAGLKRERPGVPIDFMTKPQFADVTTGNHDVDRVVPWDLNRLHDYPPRQVFYPHAAIRSGAWSNGHTHLLAMQAEMIGVQPGPAFIADEPFDLALPGVELRSSASADFVAPIVTVHATSQGGKMIAPDRWAAVVKYLQERHKDVRFVLVGGPSDLYVPGTLDLRYDHARRAPLSYRRMAFVQRHAICHLGIDSGPAHCAATVGTPSLVAWGWTDVDTCRPERYAVNLVPHYPTVCPRLGPCHGVQPACGINQYDRASAMQAPCVATLDLTPIVTILDEALGQGEPAACREWLRANSSKYRLVYAIPAPPPAPEAAAARPAA